MFPRMDAVAGIPDTLLSVIFPNAFVSSGDIVGFRVALRLGTLVFLATFTMDSTHAREFSTVGLKCQPRESR